MSVISTWEASLTGGITANQALGTRSCPRTERLGFHLDHRDLMRSWGSCARTSVIPSIRTALKLVAPALGIRAHKRHGRALLLHVSVASPKRWGRKKDVSACLRDDVPIWCMSMRCHSCPGFHYWWCWGRRLRVRRWLRVCRHNATAWRYFRLLRESRRYRWVSVRGLAEERGLGADTNVARSVSNG